ncbi:hypothetical protein VO56_02990 [Mycoplasmopsis gallinacea]|uniref:Exonuclease domain-containing protein n=1 Tax=Mycoplasmopsis gallinacea TaxID=29556 RepID=A0A0D5ZKL5_9BACT|nr:hypothetical protein VO56_02990 [Mycoplasmopsis gallinacea]
MNLSKEQVSIIEKLKQGLNLKINAVAGSGKTTTILRIADNFKDKKILFFTYNRRLMEETQERANLQGLYNLDIFTIHSFCNQKYGERANTDDGLISVIKKDKQPLRHSDINYDFIVVDEAQDLNFIYFFFIKKVMAENQNKDYQIVILGDDKQCIYGFLGADPRYLTLADRVFQNKHPWDEAELSKSFRLNKNFTDFINVFFYKNENIIEGVAKNENNEKIRYYFANYEKEVRQLSNIIINKILEYGAENVLILSPSVEKSSKIQNITNTISEIVRQEGLDEIHFHLTKNEDDLNKGDEFLKNKVLVSTYNQAKGIERDVVFVFGFDRSYYKHYAKNERQDTPQNILYVACTRAKKETWLVHDVQNKFFKWIDSNKITNRKDLVEFQNTKELFEVIKLESYEEEIEEDTTNFGAVDLVKFLDYKLENFIKSKIVIQKYESLAKEINTDFFKNITSQITVSRNKVYTEDVSSINGTLVTVNAMIKKNKEEFFDRLAKSIKTVISATNPRDKVNFSKEEIKQIYECCQKISLNKQLNPQWLLYVTNALMTVQSKNVAIFRQIAYSDCTWMESRSLVYLDKLFNRIFNNNLENIEFEVEKRDKVFKNGLDRYIIGFIDAIDDQNKIVYEFKFVNDVQNDHFKQLAAYKYLLLKTDYEKYKDYKFVLYNIKNNFAYELLTSEEDIDLIVDLMLENKIKENRSDEINDAAFIEKANSTESIDLLLNDLNKNINLINMHLKNLQTESLVFLGNEEFEQKTNESISLEETDKKQYVIFDFETWSRQTPVQIGILVTDGKQVLKHESHYINSDGGQINPAAKKAANVEYLKVYLADPFPKVWEKIKHYFNGDYICVAHNASYDVDVLKKVFERYEIIGEPFLYVDSLAYAKNHLKLTSYKQEVLARYFGIQYNAHNANDDVACLFQILQKLDFFKNTQKHMIKQFNQKSK